MADKKINLSKAAKALDKFESVDKAADVLSLSGGSTEEVKQIKHGVRLVKQAARTEASLIRLQALLVAEMSKRKKEIKAQNKRTNGKTVLSDNSINLNENAELISSKNRKSKINTQKLLEGTSEESEVIHISETTAVIIPKKKVYKNAKKVQVNKQKSKPDVIVTNESTDIVKVTRDVSKKHSGNIKNSSKSIEDKFMPKNSDFVKPKAKNLKNIKSNKDNKLRVATKKVISESVALASVAIGNPQADKNTTTDTGSESVKQAVGTTKKTVQTANRTIKTTKNTVKAVKNAPKNIKRTVENTRRAAQATYRATKVTVKVAVQVTKVAVKVLTKIAAFLLENPIVLLIVVAVFFIVYIVYAGAAVFQAGITDGEVAKESFREAGGLDDVPKHLKDALKILEECKKDKKDDFYKNMLESLKYDENNKRQSDLIYEVRYSSDGNPPTAEHPAFQYNTQFATESVKQQLKESLDWNCGIHDADILAAAYVIAEVEANPSTSDTYQVKDIKFTKEIINNVLDKVVEYKRAQAAELTGCPGGNCIEVITKHTNPEWERYNKMFEHFKEGLTQWTDYIIPLINDYRENYLNAGAPSSAVTGKYNQVRGEVNKWNDKYSYDDIYNQTYEAYTNGCKDGDSFGEDFKNNVVGFYRNKVEHEIQKEIEEKTYRCDNQHNLYSINLEFFPIDAIEVNLGFNKTDELWFEYTSEYFYEILSALETE